MATYALATAFALSMTPLPCTSERLYEPDPCLAMGVPAEAPHREAHRVWFEGLQCLDRLDRGFEAGKRLAKLPGLLDPEPMAPPAPTVAGSVPTAPAVLPAGGLLLALGPPAPLVVVGGPVPPRAEPPGRLPPPDQHFEPPHVIPLPAGAGLLLTALLSLAGLRRWT